jgi:hypothetical protein
VYASSVSELLIQKYSMYKTAVAARIAFLEHQLMIAGHEVNCPACNNRAWPLSPPTSERVLK